MKYAVKRKGAEHTVYINGRRNLEMLGYLMDAGARGVTTAELPAGLRVSAYVMELRAALGDDAIETIMEDNDNGNGKHGRYVLRAKVRRVKK